MIDLKNFASAIAQIEEEKGIKGDKILETVNMAIAAAYKKDYGEKGQVIKANLDPETGKFDLWQEKVVVDETMLKSEEEVEEERKLREEGKEPEEKEGEPKKFRFNEVKHIMLDEAKKYDPNIQPGGILKFDVEVHEEFGRIAAQTAKQVIVQRIREAERNAVYDDFSDKIDSIVSGVVQRVEGNSVFFDLGKTTGIMLAKDKIPGERYKPGQRMRLYLLSIEQTSKGPQLYLSRAHPKMLSRLFALEVPEISSGTVEVKSVAREPGSRSKIAVYSEDESIDPIGSCVGQRGTRVSAVIQELGGEKIDITEWKEESEEYIANALGPAKVLDIEIEGSRAKVIVSEDQLSLAIGKDGQNVRLAAMLTGWKIDVISKETGEVEESSEEDVSKEKNTPKEESSEESTGGETDQEEVAEKQEGAEEGEDK